MNKPYKQPAVLPTSLYTARSHHQLSFRNFWAASAVYEGVFATFFGKKDDATRTIADLDEVLRGADEVSSELVQ